MHRIAPPRSDLGDRPVRRIGLRDGDDPSTAPGSVEPTAKNTYNPVVLPTFAGADLPHSRLPARGAALVLLPGHR